MVIVIVIVRQVGSASFTPPSPNPSPPRYSFTNSLTHLLTHLLTQLVTSKLTYLIIYQLLHLFSFSLLPFFSGSFLLSHAHGERRSGSTVLCVPSFCALSCVLDSIFCTPYSGDVHPPLFALRRTLRRALPDSIPHRPPTTVYTL